MPKRILIIGLLFCLGGIGAVWDVISDFLKLGINFNFCVFLLPVGIGLLKGRSRSQWWARGWIILGYAICAVSLVVVGFWPQNTRCGWFSREIRGAEAVPYVFVLVGLLAALLAAMHGLLYSEKAKAYFNRSSEPAGGANFGSAGVPPA